MKIYISHSKDFDFKNELYQPLKQLDLPIEFIFPHEESDEPFDSKLLLERHGCDFVLAEVSNPSTGQGIELGWADAYKTPILCYYKKGSNFSGSLKVLTDRIVEYTDPKDLINKLTKELGLKIA